MSDKPKLSREEFLKKLNRSNNNNIEIKEEKEEEEEVNDDSGLFEDGDVKMKSNEDEYKDLDEANTSVELNLFEMTDSPSNILEDKSNKTYFWGTNINTVDVKKRFRDFITLFSVDVKSKTTKKTERKFIYIESLHYLFNHRKYHMNINFKYLLKFDKVLYHQWLRYPNEMIPVLDVEINDLFVSLFGIDENDDSFHRIQLHPFNIGKLTPMRLLNPSDIDQIISIRGLIIRTSSIIPDLKQGFFQCAVCEFTVSVDLIRGKISEPNQCDNCKSRFSMTMIHNRCEFGDKQYIKLQETPDAIPEGETPHTVALFAFDDLIDTAKPGDRVEITGVFKANPMKASGSNKSLRSIYKTFIDILHIKRTDKHSTIHTNDEETSATEVEYEGSIDDTTRVMTDEDSGDSQNQYINEFDNMEYDNEEFEISEEKEREILQISKRADIYEVVVGSLAPSIWELEDVKKGIICQLFGGSNKTFETTDGGGTRFRGDINILLCGDPGTSKSQLLSFVHKIAPRGIYTSGKGSSAVGLTAYITKDPDTRESVLESGALVLSDKGICCIDEFDKMSEQTRSILHEVMEQQTVSVAKAGIICSLNARTSILASANPKESRYNPKLSVVENLQLPPTLLSRFDLIYLILDKPNEKSDRMLAKHLVSLYWEVQEPRAGFTLSKEQLYNYITYAKKNINPVITDESSEILVKGYTDMRMVGDGKNTISATPRQLEALIRLSEAHARVRLSKTVEPLDVNEAIRLVKAALQQVAIDPKTGKIDMDLITTGISSSTRVIIARLKDSLMDLIGNRKEIQFDTLVKLVQAQIDALKKPNQPAQPLKEENLKEALQQLQLEQVIQIRDNTIIKV